MTKGTPRYAISGAFPKSDPTFTADTFPEARDIAHREAGERCGWMAVHGPHGRLMGKAWPAGGWHPAPGFETFPCIVCKAPDATADGCAACGAGPNG